MKAYTKPVLEVVELVSAERFADSLTIYNISNGSVSASSDAFNVGSVLSNTTADPIEG